MRCLYSVLPPFYASIPMLLITAAMEDELKIALDLCPDVKKLPDSEVSLWQGTIGAKPLCFLKAGVGPEKSAKNLESALARISPDHILVIGYAGALDPQLSLGDLVAVTKASSFCFAEEQPDWEHVQLKSSYELSLAETLASSARGFGLNAVTGSALSSTHVLGKPEHKNLLFTRFQASAVDMETAFLAGIAVSRNVPMSCVRAISDVVQDTFLEPFSYDPSAKFFGRAKKLLNTGMAHTYQEWKHHSAVAKKSLKLFLEKYLE